MGVWDAAKGDIPWYATPNYDAALFGGSGTSMQEEGTLYRYPAPSPGVYPGSIGGDIVLFSYTIAAGALDGALIPGLVGGILGTTQSYRGINIWAQGGYGATANNKRVKIIVGATSAVVGSAIIGGTTIADTGVVTTSAAGWSVTAALYKMGGQGSNTQLGVHQPTICGSTVSPLVLPQYLTLNEAAPIIVAVTGNATTLTSDITANLIVITGTN